MLALSNDPLIPGADPLLTLAVVLVAGVVGGWLAKRARLPSITGQIVIGVLMGHSALTVFDHAEVLNLQPVTHFALGLMAVTTGAHMNFARMRNAGKRLAFLVLAESLVIPTLVFLGLLPMPGLDVSAAALLATIAVSTAPATVVALVKETKSKGVFVKTLVAAVALNNMACIFLFEIARTVGAPGNDATGGLGEGFQQAAAALGKAILLGGAGAVVMEGFTRFARRKDRIASAAIATILLTSGTADYLGISPLLACLFLGIAQTNLSSIRDRLVDKAFSNFEPAILAMFFTLAGMHLNFEQIGRAGSIAVVFFVLRALGKIVAVRIAMRAAGATDSLRQFLGLALMPQAGLAIGLVILIQDDVRYQLDQPRLDLFVAVMLTAVTLNEILGPIATRWALGKAGEAGMNRSRLIDFIQEENIVTDLVAETKREAIEQLVDVLVTSHHLPPTDRDKLLQSVLDREAQVSTCFGGGLAVPHGILEGHESMLGVMGISSVGLPFETPDKRRVHCMVLLVTPASERDRHLQVLATLARVVGQNELIQAQLFHAKSPAHVWEILHGEETQDFNPFLGDDGDESE